MTNITKDMTSSITTTIKTTTTLSNSMITINNMINRIITVTLQLWKLKQRHIKMMIGAIAILLQAERKKWLLRWSYQLKNRHTKITLTK